MTRTAFYTEYIKSPAWAVRKESYYARHPRVCAACGECRRVQLHHLSYERLGHELDDDMRPLCPRCHTMVHRLSRQSSRSLRELTLEYIRLRPRYQKDSRRY